MEDVEDLAEDLLTRFLVEHYGCHTIILYGSRARGTARPNSDWDVVALNDGSTQAYCHQHVEGVGEVNAYIYPEAMVEFDGSMPSALYLPGDVFANRLQHGLVLTEKDALGEKIITRAQSFMRAGPGLPSEERMVHLTHYFYKLRLSPYLDNNIPLKPELPEAVRDYMRHEALLNAVFHYFRLRGAWQPAPKNAHRYFLEHDTAMLEALARAEQHNADAPEFHALFAHVLADAARETNSVLRHTDPPSHSGSITPEQTIVDFLTTQYDCHTVLLYGSRAENRHTPESDWDIVALTRGKQRRWCNTILQGVGEVNALIFPDSAATSAKMAEILDLQSFCFPLRFARILRETSEQFGTMIIERAKEIYASPPAPLAPGFRDTIRHYYTDLTLALLRNPEIPDMVKHYQYHECILKSLHHYFTLRALLGWPMYPRTMPQNC
jgi:predicted nucleotidyltransferase